MTSVLKAKRLKPGDRDLGQHLFAMMAAVFGEEHDMLGASYVDRVLSRPDFWAIAAIAEGDVVGGLTAHTLPMTRSESSEIFIYDLAVRPDHQRRGVGRLLVTHLLDEARAAGVEEVFVPADNDDVHALDFYRALGATGSPVTFFTFGAP